MTGRVFLPAVLGGGVWAATGVLALEPGQVRINIGTESRQASAGVVGLVRDEYGGRMLRHLDGINVVTFEISRAAFQRLRKPGGLRGLSDFVELDQRARIPEDLEFAEVRGQEPGSAGSPDDPGFPSQWGVECVDLRAAWDRFGYPALSVRVAILDTGVDTDHPDLVDRLVLEDAWDFVNEDPSPEDDHGHGTHCAGIAAAASDNGEGIAGVVGAQVLPVKVLDRDGSGYWSDVAAGIDWAVAHGAHVISLSLGGGYDSSVKRAVDAALEAGVLVFAAAGNHGTSVPNYPASLTSAIGVGALRSCEKLALYSARGFGDHEVKGNVEIVAPGSDIYSTWLGGSYASLSGTSMATPMAAGIGAGFMAITGRSAGRVRLLIQRTADPLGADSKFGYGRIDAWPLVD